METVNLTFKYTKEEYVSAVRQYYSPFHSQMSVVFSLLLTLLGLLAWLLSDDVYMSAVLISVGLFFLFIYSLNYFLMPARIYQRNPKLHEEYSLGFSDAGIIFRSKDIDSALQWSLYNRVQETDKFYFLIYGKDAFTLIPKRAFSSEEQERAFRLMLKHHVDPNINPVQLSEGARAKETEYVPKSLEPPDWR